MNRLWQRISLGREFSVIGAVDGVVRGGRFVRSGKTWRMAVWAAEPEREDGGTGAWSEVMRRIGTADCCVVTGKVEGALFFRFASTELPVAAQRGAVEFELPRRLLRMPDAGLVQFAPDMTVGADRMIGVNVAVFPASQMGVLAKKLEKSGCRADEFLYPFLAVSPELPEIFLPSVESDFYFADSEWKPVPGDPAEAAKITGRMLEALRRRFLLPGDAEFVPEEFLPILLAAKVVAGGAVHRYPDAFKALPDRIRPVRFRRHLIISALLGILLAADLVWMFSRTWGDEILEYRSLSREERKLKSQIATMKSSAKRGAKELKEMSRVVDMNVGEYDAVREFGLISDILPSDVMVSGIRWSDTDIDLVLQCENDKLDVPALIQPLKRWRVAQLQQRQAGDSAVATINLKLAPLGTQEKAKKETKR
ncbi:MAG: hypothetical protein MR051_06805 [Lentisphaeria bacterium]|nr:hypothetical protein [Lentisphaeria bacterium]